MSNKAEAAEGSTRLMQNYDILENYDLLVETLSRLQEILNDKRNGTENKNGNVTENKNNNLS